MVEVHSVEVTGLPFIHKVSEETAKVMTELENEKDSDDLWYVLWPEINKL